MKIISLLAIFLVNLTLIQFSNTALLPDNEIGDYKPNYELSDTCDGVDSLKMSDLNYLAGLEIAKRRFIYGRENLEQYLVTGQKKYLRKIGWQSMGVGSVIEDLKEQKEN